MIQTRLFSNGEVSLQIRQLADGNIEFDAEQAAIGLGIYLCKNGIAYVRWERVRKYLNSPQVEKGDFITESQFYRLAIKANNSIAEKFQDWVTGEVLPSIRKTGTYSTAPQTQLSPELQFMQGVVNKLAASERNQRRLEGKIDSVSEIVATSTMDWRNETSHLIGKVARQQGNTGEAFRNVRNDIYDEVDRRGGVSLKTRLTNLRRRMAEEGVSRTSRTNTTKVDVISQDKKLIEIYTAIVKEFAIKFQVWNEEY